MDFIVKDLMISVLPFRRSAGGAGDIGPRANSCDAGATGCGTCTGMTTCPGGCTGGTPHPADWWAQVVNPITLSALKQQLRETLAAVEAREAVIHESMRPSSATELQMLQTHLESALEEVRGMAKKLNK
jgi:hypothetical protein